MTTDKPDSLIRKIFEEGFNRGHLAVADELFSPDHLAHNPIGSGANGPQGFKLLILMFRNAFPDLHCTVEDEISQGNKVAAHWVMYGTQRGPFMGNQPTGRQVEIQGIVFARTENGRIVEDWTLVDQMGILQQLGVVPPSWRHER